ncbi:MAG TPA: glycosyltransferase [Terriglobia bacterium]|nr:glycosyltransferase [Terriglobia bacterium]
MMLNPVAHYRVARWLHRHHIPFLPYFVQRLSFLMLHCHLPYRVEAGEGFAVGHSGISTVIHRGTRIGRNVFVGHGVTIGGRNRSERVPRIEDNVYIAPGAQVLGDIVVGEGSLIGANAVVLHSVPPRSIVAGVPARVIRENINIYDYTGWPLSLAPRAEEEAPRVFHMIDSLNLGGSETQLANVAIRQSAGGYHVVVGCLRAQGPLVKVLEDAGIPVLNFPPGGSLVRPGAVRQFLRLVWLLRRQRFDVVQTHDLYSNLMGVPAAWLARVPVIVSSRRDLAHWWWYTPRNRRILRGIQSLSVFVVANSDAVRNYLEKEDGFTPDHVRIVRNGVDPEPFLRASANRETLFPRLSLEDKLMVVVANMNIKGKGQGDLIEAARRICAEVPRARFILVGDGRERAGLENKVAELGLVEHFVFLGKRNDVPDVLSCCDVSVLPSWAEGMPNSILESMAAGLPVVGTRVGGIPEIIEDEVSGLLVPPRDPQALAKAILRLLRDPEFSSRLALAGRERVRIEFSFDRVLRQLRELYEEGWVRSGQGQTKSFALKPGVGVKSAITQPEDPQAEELRADSVAPWTAN